MPSVEMDMLQRALRRCDWPRSPWLYVPGFGFCVGASLNGQRPLLQLARSRLQLELTRAANALIAAACPPEFRWTSLQFNRNTTAKLHTDKNNEGLSFILIARDFEGGAFAFHRAAFALRLEFVHMECTSTDVSRITRLLSMVCDLAWWRSCTTRSGVSALPVSELWRRWVSVHPR